MIIYTIGKIPIACLVLLVAGGLSFIAGAAAAKPGKNKPVPAGALVVPLGGNTWLTGGTVAGGSLQNQGIVGWTSQETAFTTHVRFARAGKVQVWLHLKAPGTAGARIRVTALGQSRTIQVEGPEYRDWYAGEWKLPAAGYVAFRLSRVGAEAAAPVEVASIKFSGGAAEEGAAYVKDNAGDFFYWGRRGPSVHLNYQVPADKELEWFYNEVTVPAGNDVVGSYFMANGFAEGYFGMQVNSATERRILFSVWSPFRTDDPASIPDAQKIKLLRKGEAVYTGEFGNEGSGGQSYLRYNWKAGTTYRFLLQGRPAGPASTRFTAYFFAPEAGHWQLIASFERPQTRTYLKRLHSFLENFKPESGNTARQVLFTNQWVRDIQGQWTEVNRAHFTGDNTAAKKYRMDHAGGLQGNALYLRNCGFFSDFTPLKTYFERPAQAQGPPAELRNLPE